MVRVLFVTGEYPPMPGGVGDYTQRLAAALEQLGCQCSVLTAKGAAGQPRVVASVDSWRWSLLSLLARTARQVAADLVHVQYQAGAFDLHPVVHVLPLSLRWCPVVTTFHDTSVPYLFPKAGPLRQWANALLARSSAAIVATNPEDATQLASWRPSRLCTIPIGSNLPAPNPSARAAMTRQLARMQRPTVGFFGFFTPDKGLDDLLDALERLPDPRPVLVVIGGTLGARSTPHRAYAAALEDRLAHLPGPVLRTGYLEPEAAAAALAAVDLVVLPFRDGASFRHGTLVAALTAGAPVITTAPPHLEWLTPLRDREHCWLVPPRSPEVLAQAIQTLLNDLPTRRRLGAAAHQLAGRLFAWPTIARQHLALYEEVQNRTTKGGKPA